MDDLTSDHECLTAELRSEMDSLRNQIKNDTSTLQSEIQEKTEEIFRLRESHADEVDRLQRSSIDTEAQAQQEVEAAKKDLEQTSACASSETINELRSELTLQFSVVSTLRCNLADSRMELNKAEIDIDRLRSELVVCDQHYRATKLSSPTAKVISLDRWRL